MNKPNFLLGLVFILLLFWPGGRCQLPASPLCSDSTFVKAKLCPVGYNSVEAGPYNCLCNPFDYSAACEAGFMDGSFPSTCDTSMAQVVSCCPGYFCPFRLNCMMECPEGAYCPSPSTLVNTGETLPCSLETVSAPTCFPNGNFPFPDLGCGGASNVSLTHFLCPGGCFCSDPISLELCPNGSYCRPGSVTPTECPLHSECDEGSSVPKFNVISLILCIGLLVLMAIFPPFWKFLRRSNKKEPQAVGSWFLSNLIGLLWGIWEVLRLGFLLFFRIAWIIVYPFVAVARNIHSWRKQVPSSFDEFTLEVKIGKVYRGGKVALEFNKPITMASKEIWAIMGASGSGKSTLLKCISQRDFDGQVMGTCEISSKNDAKVYDLFHHFRVFQPLIGVAPQNDVVHEHLSVEEHLTYWAHIRNPNPNGISTLVTDCLKAFGMLAEKDSSTSSLSGGQLKRLNVMLEIVSGPKILFLDEATSGLDSDTTLVVIRALQELAFQNNLLVAVVIHQPSEAVFEKFTHVLLLQKGEDEVGRILSQGTRPDVLNEHAIRLPVEVVKSTPDELVNKANHDRSHGKIAAQPGAGGRGWLQKEVSRFSWIFWLVFIQTMNQLLPQFFTLIIPFSAAGIIGLLLHENAFEDMLSSIFMVCLVVTLLATQASLQFLGGSHLKPVLVREIKSGVNPIYIYLIRGELFSILYITLFSIVFTTAFFLGFENRSNFGDFFEIVFLLGFAAVGLGNAIAVMVDSTVALLVAVAIPLVLSFLGGFNPTRGDLEEYGFIVDLSVIRWGFEALTLVESAPLSDAYDNPLAILFGTFDINKDNLGHAINMLVLYAGVFRLMALLILCHSLQPYPVWIKKCELWYVQAVESPKKKSDGVESLLTISNRVSGYGTEQGKERKGKGKGKGQEANGEGSRRRGGEEERFIQGEVEGDE